MDKIWPSTKGAGVTIGVVDTGVNAKLPDLTGRVLPGGDTSGRGTGDGRTDTDPGVGHGTTMAMLMVGQGRATGMVGLAPEAKVLPVVGDAGGAATPNAIRFAVDHGAKVVSISLFSPGACSPEEQAAVAYAAQHDVVVVAGTGNQGSYANGPGHPGDCAGVVAVGADGPDMKPWVDTERVDYVTISAPGVHVGSVGRTGRYYSDGWGTSQATALTAAGVALVRAAHPEMSARTIVQRMIATAKDIGKPGRDDQTGYGTLRIHRVLDLSFQVPPTAPNPVYDRLDQWLGRSHANPATDHGSGAASQKKHGPNVLVIAIGGVLAVGVIGAVVAAAMWLTAKRRLRDLTSTNDSAPSARDAASQMHIGVGRGTTPGRRPPERPDFLPPNE